MCNKIFGGFFPLLKWFPRSCAFRRVASKIPPPARLQKLPIKAPKFMHGYTSGGGQSHADSGLFGLVLLSHCTSFQQNFKNFCPLGRCALSDSYRSQGTIILWNVWLLGKVVCLWRPETVWEPTSRRRLLACTLQNILRIPFRVKELAVPLENPSPRLESSDYDMIPRNTQGERYHIPERMTCYLFSM